MYYQDLSPNNSKESRRNKSFLELFTVIYAKIVKNFQVFTLEKYVVLLRYMINTVLEKTHSICTFS